MDSTDVNLSVPHAHSVQHGSPQMKHIAHTHTPDAQRKPKIQSVRRACAACHSGKTKCNDVLPCQNCIKKGQGATCAYPDLDTVPGGPSNPPGDPQTVPSSTPYPASVYGTSTTQPQFYQDYNGSYPAASSSSYRPPKRPRLLTEEETAIIRNYQRGDFYVGGSAPVRIDSRLPVQLTLADGDIVHFLVGDTPPKVVQ